MKSLWSFTRSMPRFSLLRANLRTALTVGLVIFAIAIATTAWPRHTEAMEVLRVGADTAPPFHTVQPNGGVQGLAFDVLSEAARRRHIRLVWIPLPTGTMDEALARGDVDVWPALSRTPERDRVLHFSKPWLESNYCLLSEKTNDVTAKKTEGAILGVAASPRVASLAATLFPSAGRIPLPTNIAVVQAVCRGDVTAGFLDTLILDAALLKRPEGCGSTSFRVHFVPEASNPVSLAGRPQVADLIDSLREGITPLVANGYFADAVDRWSGVAGAQMRSYFELRESRLHGEAWFYAVLLLLATAALMTWQICKQRISHRRAAEALKVAADCESRFEAFMNHSPTVSFMKDKAGRLLYANRQFREVFEPTLGDFIGKNDFDLWPADAAAKIRRDDVQVIEENRSAETIDSVPNVDGDKTTWLSIKFPFRMGGEVFLGGVSIDITARERDKERLRVSEERFRRTFEHAAIGIVVTDAKGWLQEVNPAFCAITGYEADHLLSMNLADITHPDDRDESESVRLDADRDCRNSFSLVKRCVREDSSAIRVRLNVGIVRDTQGTPLNYVALVEDITLERQREENAWISEQRWQLALQGATDGIWDWDARNNTVFFSPRWKEMLGFQDMDLPNRADIWEDLLHPMDHKYATTAVTAHLEKRSESYCAEYRMRCKDGSYKWVLARGKAIWDADGNPVRLIGTHTDITPRKEAEEKLLYQATHDPLTGLANRRSFLSRLEEEVTLASAIGEPLSLCICDIDFFKSINDREGHKAGDDVLVTFARLLDASTRKRDLAGRMGGDEFYVLLAGTSAAKAAVYVERIRERLHTIAFGGNTGTVFSVTASFGIAELSAFDTAEMIERADRALYSAKEAGRNTVHAFAR